MPEFQITIVTLLIDAPGKPYFFFGFGLLFGFGFFFGIGMPFIPFIPFIRAYLLSSFVFLPVTLRTET